MRRELKYGLLAGLAMIAWTLAEYALGLHNAHFALGRYTGWGTEAILLLMLWRVTQARFAALDRYWMPAWDGMLHGLLAGLAAGLVYYMFLSLYVTLINPEWIDLSLEWQVARMRAAGESELAVRGFVRSFRWMAGPIGLAVLTAGLYAALGAVFSGLVTIWLNLRRKEPPPVD
ncbi:MAG TPA: DUF4199 family protein [Lacunisphaera sp.]|nr:DUF4199 family protein [Lacunisphaera sp.]